MKQLSEIDIEKMVGGEFVPDDRAVNRAVRANLKLGTLMPPDPQPIPDIVRLDLHQNTEEMAWEKLNELLESGARTAHIITGASGILKIKFIDWTKNSTIAPKITTVHALNNGSFEIKIRRKV